MRHYTDDELEFLSHWQRVGILSGEEIKNGETFPWRLVEFSAKDESLQARYGRERLLSHLPHKSKYYEIPLPEQGYDWYWVDNMHVMSGHGGWLEVDLKNKRQGRYVPLAMS